MKHFNIFTQTLEALLPPCLKSERPYTTCWMLMSVNQTFKQWLPNYLVLQVLEALTANICGHDAFYILVVKGQFLANDFTPWSAYRALVSSHLTAWIKFWVYVQLV